MLTWTAHKFSESGAAEALELEAIVSPLKMWLQLLAANVPEASVIVVGTHCRVDDAHAAREGPAGLGGGSRRDGDEGRTQ